MNKIVQVYYDLDVYDNKTKNKNKNTVATVPKFNSKIKKQNNTTLSHQFQKSIVK